MQVKVAYLMSRFPHLPETFILREMSEMERQGWEVALYPLIFQNQPVVHAEARAWLPRVRQLPYFSGPVMQSTARRFWKSPASVSRLVLRALKENMGSPNFLVRSIALLPKTFLAAEQMVAENVTHIHAHFATHPAFAAWVIHKLTGIPYSVTVHAHDIFVRRNMLETKLREASFIAAISEFNREYLANLYGDWIREKTAIVRCGVTPENYQPRPRFWQAGQPVRLINVSSLQPYKGQSYLVEACAILKNRGIPFECRIVGGGEERERLQRLIQQHNLGEQVKLLGPQPQEEVARLLEQADCYVQPSIITPSGKMEGIPVALMEALASQLPVVATSISGIPELVQEGKTGVLVPPGDPEALAAGIETVYADPEGAARMAASGRQLVLQEFNLETNVHRLGALIGQVYAGEPAPGQLPAFLPQN